MNTGVPSTITELSWISIKDGRSRSPPGSNPAAKRCPGRSSILVSALITWPSVTENRPVNSVRNAELRIRLVFTSEEGIDCLFFTDPDFKFIHEAFLASWVVQDRKSGLMFFRIVFVELVPRHDFW